MAKTDPGTCAPALRFLNRQVLKMDDAMAAAEQQAILNTLGNVPAYCADRYLRAMAGGPVNCDEALARAKTELAQAQVELARARAQEGRRPIRAQ